MALEAPAPPGQAAAPAPPPAFPPGVRATVQWLQSRFAAWYAQNPPPMPDRFTRREFGFILWPERPGPPPFLRHRAYEAAERFHSYLRWSGPHSVYYSTAYYRRPGELRMADKGWLGAELIFDLDADHLAEAERAKAEGREMPLSDQLALVKTQFKRLVDDFLLGDFGLGEDDVWITFSGGRGYHAHVTEARLMQLGSKERREVVDYITGKVPVRQGTDEPDLDLFLRSTAVQARPGFGDRPRVLRTVRLAPPTTPGWPGRMTRAIVADLRHNVQEADDRDAVRWLRAIEGIGEKGAREFVARLRRDPGYVDRLESSAVVSQGHLFQRIALDVLGRHSLPLAKGETDEPVTADVKRLIRLPGSLHGKSGLKVVTLRRDELDGFEPLRDAVAFGMDPVRIVPRNDQEATLGGQRVSVRKGGATEVPEAHAVFWLSRQAGTVA